MVWQVYGNGVSVESHGTPLQARWSQDTNWVLGPARAVAAQIKAGFDFSFLGPSQRPLIFQRHHWERENIGRGGSYCWKRSLIHSAGALDDIPDVRQQAFQYA